MKIALAQFDPVVGDISGNARRIADYIDRAAEAGADLAVFSELSLCGYPPRDLLLKEAFIAQNLRAVEELAKHCTRTAALVGFARPSDKSAGRRLYNAAALLAQGRKIGEHVKSLLPTYDVFDETRYFEPGGPPQVLVLPSGGRIGVTICEDLWDPMALGRRLYSEDPAAALAGLNVDVIINMSASPYQHDKLAVKRSLLGRQARRVGKPIVYVNQVGGNDELIFDGASWAVDSAGTRIAQCKRFGEDLVVVDLEAKAEAKPAAPPPEVEDGIAGLKGALELGLRDYVHKCTFTRVVLGLSGGIDSALVAVLAADALGPQNVLGVSMPSRYSSEHSKTDAAKLAENLGIKYEVVPIERMHGAAEVGLSKVFANVPPDLTEENLQARMRGAIIMAISNKFGHLALTTGNKSELSTGYCTLYGDMCGGLAPIGDVPKTMVYSLCKHINERAGYDRVPANTLVKPPSAELRPNQTDQDTLPPYEVLDEVLAKYVEQEKDAQQIIAEGFDAAMVRKVIRMVDSSEYKRRQAAPALKVTGRAFGAGRRMPIAQRFKYE